MRRRTSVATILGCAVLAGVLLHQGTVSPPSATTPAPRHEQPPPTQQQANRDRTGEPQVSREVVPTETSRNATEQADRAITVQAFSPIGSVSGGEVRLIFDRGSMSQQPLDANGTAVFKLGDKRPEQVIVRVPGYVMMSRQLESAEPQVVKISMLRAGTLRVHLLDSSGRRLPSRYVQTDGKTSIRPENPLDRCHSQCDAITNEQGIAILDNAVPGTQEVVTHEHSHWLEARRTDAEVFSGQVSDVTLVVPELDQRVYAGVLFPPKVIAEVKYADTGEVEGYRLFYGEIESVLLFKEWDQGFVAVVPAPSGAMLMAFLAECDNTARVRPGGRRTKPFQIVVGGTVTRTPEWEQ